MSELVADCPRCSSAKITFDLESSVHVETNYNWQRIDEAFCICRHCGRSTIFRLSQLRIEHNQILEHATLDKLPGSVNNFFRVENYVSQKDKAPIRSPEHLPKHVEAVFNEGTKCLAINCYNAAGTMFRLCLDLATKSFLPALEEDAPGLNSKTRRDLGLRLPWLFNNGKLPAELKDLSDCIKEDGNDGAHAGTLTEPDARDILDFTYELLERIYTEPKRIELAKERRAARRAQRQTT